MNIISCKGCGVMLDKDVLLFPEDIHEEDIEENGEWFSGGVDEGKAIWKDRDYHPAVECPVCKTLITETGEC